MKYLIERESAASLSLHSLRGVLGWGVELRLWVASCVTGLALFVDRVTSPTTGGAEPYPLAVVFFATLALYNLDGSLDAVSAETNRPVRKRLHLALTLSSTTLLAVFIAELSQRALLLTALGLALSAAYAVPLGREATDRRLKSLPHLKAPFVGVAVATAVVWVPAWSSHAEASMAELCILTVVLALYCTANAILFDIPDQDEDRRARVPTVVVVGGVAHGKNLAHALCAVGLALSPTLALVSDPTRSNLSGIASLWLLGVALLLASGKVHANTPKTTIAWWVDGALLLPLFLHTVLNKL